MRTYSRASLLGALGCGCDSNLSGLGDCSGPNVPVYLFWLDTQSWKPGVNGPYQVAQVPFAFLGQNAVKVPNTPPDSVALDAANVGASNAGATQVQWLSQSIFPNQTSIVGGGGSASVNSANEAGTSGNFVFYTPDDYLVAQAGQLANASDCGMIRVGWIAQSTTARQFLSKIAPVNTAPIASSAATPTVNAVMASTANTQPAQSQVVSSQYAEPAYVAGNSAITSPPPAASDSSNMEIILLLLGVGALIALS